MRRRARYSSTQLAHYPSHYQRVNISRSVKGGLSLQAVEGDRGVGTNGQITLEELDGVRGSVSRRRKPQSACILISRDSTCREDRADQGGRCREGKASGR